MPSLISKITHILIAFRSFSSTMSSTSLPLSSGKKSAIRSHVKHLLNSLSSNDIEEESIAIYNRLKSMKQYQESKNICLYLSMPTGEVRSNAIINDAFEINKNVFIPKITGKNFQDLKMIEIENVSVINSFPRSKWGIPEPPKDFVDASIDGTYQSIIDCVIVPGVAFESNCARIGHGKGYYDSFLDRVSTANIKAGKLPPVTIGLAFNKQILETDTIPLESHDKVLGFVVTPFAVYSSHSLGK